MVGSFQENASVPREQTPPETFFFSIVTAKFPEYLPWENLYPCHLIEINFGFLLILKWDICSYHFNSQYGFMLVSNEIQNFLNTISSDKVGSQWVLIDSHSKEI